MITKRKEAKELIAEYEKIFAPIIGKPCRLTWDKFDFEDVVVQGIEIAKTTGRKNIPDKRENGEKNSTPMLFVLNTDQGELLFALDDVQVSAIFNGVRISIPQENPVTEAKTLEIDLRIMEK